MKYSLMAIAVVAVLTGCGQRDQIDNQVVIPEPAVKDKAEVQENTVVAYEVPELGIVFDIDKNYADDLVYEYSNRNNEGVSFSSKITEERFNCGLGYSGAVSKYSFEEGCLHGREPEVVTDNYAFCFSGPQALCTDNPEQERGDGIASVDVVLKALQTLREL